jgi:hypothetical protein
VSESEFLAAVEHISNVLATKHRFGSHDTDDIKQMVVVFSLEALPKYDPTKGNLEGYLYRNSCNRLLNLRRNELGVRSDPPCRICYDQAIGRGDGHPGGEVCARFRRWWGCRQARSNIAMPYHIEMVSGLEQERGMWAESTVETAAEHQEMYDLIDAHLPLDLRADYLKMRAGVEVPKLKRDRVLAAIRDILENPFLYESGAADTTTDGAEPEDWSDDDDDDGGD